MFLSLLERRCAQCGVIMLHDSEEAFVEMWVEQRGKCVCVLYAAQVSQSLVPLSHLLEFTVIFPLIALNISKEFFLEMLHKGMKSFKNLRRQICKTVATMGPNSGLCGLEYILKRANGTREAGCV